MLNLDYSSVIKLTDTLENTKWWMTSDGGRWRGRLFDLRGDIFEREGRGVIITHGEWDNILPAL